MNKIPSPNKPRRLGDGRWSCSYRWTDSTGRRRCKTVYGTARADVYRAASAAQMEEVVRARRGDDLEPERPAMPTFAQLADQADTDWWPSRGTKSHHRLQRTRIDEWWLPAVGHLAVDRITAGHIAGIVSRAKSSGRSAATCNRILSAGGVVLQFAVRLRLIEANPAHAGGALRLKEPKRRKTVLTAEQLRRLVDACEPKWQPLVGLMAYAGLRHGEAVLLQGEDVDLERAQITVRRGSEEHDTTKGKRDRVIPIAPPLRVILSAVKLRTGRRVSRLRDPRAALQRAAEKIGVDLHVHPHLLRHSFGTALGQAGVGAAVIQRLLGHVDLSTTQGYVHVDVEPGHVDVFGER